MSLLEDRTNRIQTLAALLSLRRLPGNMHEDVIEAGRRWRLILVLPVGLNSSLSSCLTTISSVCPCGIPLTSNLLVLYFLGPIPTCQQACLSPPFLAPTSETKIFSPQSYYLKHFFHSLDSRERKPENWHRTALVPWSFQGPWPPKLGWPRAKKDSAIPQDTPKRSYIIDTTSFHPFNIPFFIKTYY